MWRRDGDPEVRSSSPADDPVEGLLASQFHPEFKSRPTRAHPLFREFVKAAMKQAG